MNASPKAASNGARVRSGREPSQYDKRAVYQLILVTCVLILSIALSIYFRQGIEILGYTVVIVYAFYGVVHHNRPWQDLGLKHGFVKDFKRVWYYFGIDALLFQVLPPTVAVAFVLGYYNELIKQITGRLSVNFGSLEGMSAVGSLLAAALILTLIEEVVYRVTIQERLSWLIGTPAAILFASVIFGLAHAAGTSGSPWVVLTDVAGVALDGIFFGIIYAKTHNLALTWATHYTADVVGLIALLLIF